MLSNKYLLNKGMNLHWHKKKAYIWGTLMGGVHKPRETRNQMHRWNTSCIWKVEKPSPSPQKWNLRLRKEILDESSKWSEGRRPSMKFMINLPASYALTDFSAERGLFSYLEPMHASSRVGNEWNATLLSVACRNICSQDFSHFDSAFHAHTTEVDLCIGLSTGDKQRY